MAVSMNLQKHTKSGIYRWRRRVPDACQAAIGKVWIIENLGTKDRDEAKRKALPIAAYWEAAFAQARAGTYQTEAERTISAFVSDWINEMFMVRNNPDAKWTPPFRDIREIEASIDEWQQFELDQFGENDQFDDDTRRAIVLAAAKWYGEQGQYDSPKAPETVTPVLSVDVKQIPVEPASPDNIPISEALTMWIAENNPIATTESDWKTAVERFKTVVGSDIGVRSITSEHCHAFKDALAKMPARGKPDQLLSAKTVNKNIAAVQSVIQIAITKGKCTVNPMAGVKAKLPKKSQRPPARLSFTTDHLKTIFDALPGGTASPRKRTASFWLPLIALYSGARIEELGQLLITDVRERFGVHYLAVTTEGDGTRVKTEDSLRRVPLHPEVIAAGFLTYVQAVKDRGEHKLFPDVKRKPKVKGQLTAAFSKKFNRWLRRIGITDSRLVFHSFRHTFKDACRDCDVPKDVRDLGLMGHASGDVADEYGGGFSLTKLDENMRKVRYPLDLSHLHVA